MRFAPALHTLHVKLFGKAYVLVGRVLVVQVLPTGDALLALVEGGEEALKGKGTSGRDRARQRWRLKKKAKRAQQQHLFLVAHVQRNAVKQRLRNGERGVAIKRALGRGSKEVLDACNGGKGEQAGERVDAADVAGRERRG